MNVASQHRTGAHNLQQQYHFTFTILRHLIHLWHWLALQLLPAAAVVTKGTAAISNNVCYLLLCLLQGASSVCRVQHMRLTLAFALCALSAKGHLILFLIIKHLYNPKTMQKGSFACYSMRHLRCGSGNAVSGDKQAMRSSM